MRPFDKFKEIDARLAALEAAIQKPKPGPIVPDAMEQIIAGRASVTDFVWTLSNDMPAQFPSKFPSEPAPGVESIDGPVQIYEWRRDQLAAPIVDAKPIASATIAPPAAKRRGRPPKPA